MWNAFSGLDVSESIMQIKMLHNIALTLIVTKDPCQNRRKIFNSFSFLPSLSISHNLSLFPLMSPTLTHTLLQIEITTAISQKRTLRLSNADTW